MLKSTLITLFVLILCSFETRGDDNDDDDVPYTVEIDNFEISTEYDKKFIDWDTLGLQKKGRNQFVMSGTFILNLNLADEQKINLQIFTYNKERNVKGPLVFNLEKEVCKFIAEDEDMYPGVKAKSNLPDPGTCPLPKKEYSVENYEIRADFLPDDIPKGEYLLVFLLKDGLTPVAGFTAVITIED